MKKQPKKKSSKPKKLSKKQIIKKVKELLEQFDWMFSVKNFERSFVIKTQTKEDTALEIFLEEDYQRISIFIYPCFFHNKAEDQRKMILHEFCHIITIPSKDLSYKLLDGKLVSHEIIKEANEKATSQIENLLDALLRDKLRYAKEAYKKYL